MWKPNFSICVKCERERLIVVKKGLCKQCNEVLKNKPIPQIKRSRLPPEKRLKLAKGILNKFKPRKASGELAFFRQLWSEREHISEFSGLPLFPETHPQWHWQFSHYLSKKSYGKFRLNPDNIFLCLPEEHQFYEFKSWDDEPRWAKIKKKRTELKEQYYIQYYGLKIC